MRFQVVFFLTASVCLAVSSGDWSGEIRTDPMTDEQMVMMSTYNTADLLDAFFFGSAVPEFFLVFNEGDDSPLIGVDFNKYIGFGGRESTCLIRIDDAPAQEYPVVIDNSSQMIGIYIGEDTHVREFYADLLRGGQFLIRFTPAGQAQVTTEFSLSGITAVSRELGIDVDYYLNLGIPNPASSVAPSGEAYSPITRMPSLSTESLQLLRENAR